MRFAAILCLIASVSAAMADVDRSPRPDMRPEAKQAVPLAKLGEALKSLGARSPQERAQRREQRAGDRRAQSMQGAVCNNPAIKGQRISRIPGRIRGCGIEEPVRITEVSGIRLTQAATVDCTTASALNQWVKDSVIPLTQPVGGGVQALQVVAHYACRTRNNRPGAKISEHGRGRAIDISAIHLRNGQAIHVLTGWRNRQTGPILKRLHAAACGPFGTVLGPNSDRFHQDHFHFDTARYRSGPFCR